MTLVLAMLLDAWLGEPRWLWSRAPHPAVLMGRLIGWADARFNRGAARRLKGVAVMVVLGLGAVTLGAVYELFNDPNNESLRQQIKLDKHSKVLLFSTEGDTAPDVYRSIVW